MCKDLKDIEVDDKVWHEEGKRSRAGWRAMYRTGLEDWKKNQVSQEFEVAKEVMCELCSRVFRNESDEKHHKCVAEWQKHINE